MTKVTVLGGAGAVGSVATRTLAASGVFDEIVVADRDLLRARALAGSLGFERASAAPLEADDEESVRRVSAGARVVLNCVGPFYRYAPIILSAIKTARIDYVDVCDDFDATEKLLAMDEEVRAAGISALIGMGSSPGVANVIARVAADHLFDQVDAIDIYHAHGGEPEEGRAVVAHRIHSMVMDVPVFLDGRLQSVRLFEGSGEALEEDVEFEGLGTYHVYAYPHPETLTLPAHVPGVRQVTNKGLVLPPAYAELIKGAVRLGITSEEPIECHGQYVPPIAFAISFLLSRRGRLTQEAGLEGPVGCLKMVIRGGKEGRGLTYVFSLASEGRGMGEGTGLPAALGTILAATGKIRAKGVVPPEVGVEPAEFFALLAETVGASGQPLPLCISRIPEGGTAEQVPVDALLSLVLRG
jgi:saccharopine dehydrogenase (NAD+, L-lysine-forming)